MILLSDPEAVHTRAKLAKLEALVEETRRDSNIEDEEFRKLSIQSLMRLVKQLKEEIGWYEARQREVARRREPSKLTAS